MPYRHENSLVGLRRELLGYPVVNNSDLGGIDPRMDAEAE
jgi:hypothetical protein